MAEAATTATSAAPITTSFNWSAYKYTAALGSIGAAAGLGYAFMKKTGFWKGAGIALLFSIAGSWVGAGVDTLQKK